MSGRPWLFLPLESRHAKEAANLHMDAFSGFFLSSLGRPFLRELYRAFSKESGGIGLVAADAVSNRLVGVVAGALEPGAFFRRLALRRAWAFAYRSLPALARHPRSVCRLVRGLSYRGGGAGHDDKKRALLNSIAVAPDQQGTGLGSALLKEWVQAVRVSGASGCYLTTDAVDNDAVNLFYVRNGWRVVSEFPTRESRRMYRYVLDWE